MAWEKPRRLDLEINPILCDLPPPPNSDPSLDFRRKPLHHDLSREIAEQIEKIDELIENQSCSLIGTGAQ
ncbi:MAG: hypothetical protein MPJ06_08650 [Nitrosopumilus sp.]|nr:hypothetical protein [Nitrosopumilus sp.]MDA7944049.1 hypothetical protein [Nitrosopumilus sp.]MDA7999424.1 hypothetical protein [Nitrosopumilus sp.]